MAARATKSIGAVRYWPVAMPTREPTLREQNLIGNVLAHIEVERKRQAGWIKTVGYEEGRSVAWWGPWPQ